MVETFFDVIFMVEGQDPGGKKYNKVSRFEASSEQYDMFMQLDVNTEGYPIQAGEKFRMVLAPTLHLDGSDVTDYFTVGQQKSLADKFDYVMYGIIYKISNEGSGPDVKGQAKVEAARVLAEDFAGANRLSMYPSICDKATSTIACWLERLDSGPSPKGPGH